MMKKWGLYSVSILILGLVIACPSADPVDEPEQKEEKQEVVTLDAGVPDGTSPEEDAGSVVPPEASDAGTPTPGPSDAGSNAPQDQWWLDAGLIFGCMTDADCTTLNGHGACNEADGGGYEVEVFTGRCKFYEGGTSESTFSYCKLQTEVENCSDCSCGDGDANVDAGLFIPPLSPTLNLDDGGVIVDMSDGGMANAMNGFAAAAGGFSCVGNYQGCGNANSGPFTCCHKTLEVCQTTKGFASCRPKNSQGCGLWPNTKYCAGSGAGKGQCCDKSDNCESFWGYAWCEKTRCPSGEVMCDDNTDCCPTASACVPLGSGFEACSRNTCKPGESICGGKWKRCCPAGTICSKGGSKNPNCIPKGRTDCKETASFIDEDSGQCLCEAVCSQDTEYQVCGDDLCGGSCGECSEGSSCSEDSTGGICLPDEVETPDAGLLTPEPEPMPDAGMSTSGCEDGCPDYGLECSDIDGMPGMQTVLYQKGECQESTAGVTPYCYYTVETCTADQCAYGVCDSPLIDNIGPVGP